MNEITINYGRTVNLGNYESLRVDVQARRTINSEEDPETVAKVLYKELKNYTMDIIRAETVR